MCRLTPPPNCCVSLPTPPTSAAVHTGQYPSGASAIDEEGEESGPLAPLSGKKAAGPRRGAALSGVQASVNLVKCAIGAGSFSLPYAFAQGGLLFSFVGTILLGAISAYTVTMLAQCEVSPATHYRLGCVYAHRC